MSCATTWTTTSPPSRPSPAPGCRVAPSAPRGLCLGPRSSTPTATASASGRSTSSAGRRRRRAARSRPETAATATAARTRDRGRSSPPRALAAASTSTATARRKSSSPSATPAKLLAAALPATVQPLRRPRRHRLVRFGAGVRRQRDLRHRLRIDAGVQRGHLPRLHHLLGVDHDQDSGLSLTRPIRRGGTDAGDDPQQLSVRRKPRNTAPIGRLDGIAIGTIDEICAAFRLMRAA